MKQKQIVSFVLAALLLFACAGIAAALEQDTEGYYLLGSSTDLVDFGKLVNEGSVDINGRLTADIDLSGVDWKPIGDGNYNCLYVGTFDGGGRTVSGLSLTADDAVDWEGGAKALGFFGVVGQGGVVRSLVLDAPKIDATDGAEENIEYPAGAVVGVLSLGIIENCTVTGGSMAGSDAGGVIGYSGGGTVSNCTASGIERIEGSDCAGGVVGYNIGNVVNCTASEIDSISAPGPSSFAGGVVGYHQYGTIVNCTVSGIGSIKSDISAGGVVGGNYGSITSCTVQGIGEIIGTGDTAGGIVGDNYSQVRNCFAFDIALLDGGTDAGGIVGYSGGGSAALSNCAAKDIGTAQDREAGGIAGYISSSGTVANCVLVAGGTPTKLDGKDHEGGVLGYLSGGVVSLPNITNCLYPSNVTFVNYEDKPIGNIPLTNMDAQYHVTSYNAGLSEDQLPAVMAMIADGMALEVEAGKTLPVDITTLPGTKSADQHTYQWIVASTDVATVDPDNKMAVTLSGVEIGRTTLTCEIRPVAGGTGTISADLTCAVNVVETKPEPTPGGGSSSNCNSGIGAAVFALLGLAVVGKRK